MKKTQILASLAIATMLMSCGGQKKEKAATEAVEVKQKTQVLVESIVAEDVEQKSTFTGTVEAKVTNNIAPQSMLRIAKILVEVGDVVKENQILATLDPTQLRQAKIQLDNNKIEFERVDELYKIGGSSKSEWDARKLALEISQESFKNLSENTTLRSPISGIVTARNLDNGDLYNGASPILVVEQIKPVKLLINVSEKLFTSIKKGMNVNVTTDVYGDQVFAGKVTIIHPKINTATRTFPVEIEISNQDSKILPGMFARVEVSHGVENHVLVPDQAVIKQTGSGDRYVYVYNNGKVDFRKVELGRRIGNKYEILSGDLSDGQQVLVSSHSVVTNGMEVEIKK